MTTDEMLRRLAGRDGRYAKFLEPGAVPIAPQTPGPRPGAPARALPVVPVCGNGGTDADIVERCPSCTGGGKHVRDCAVHDRCTLDPVNPDVMSCSRCRAEGLGYVPGGPSLVGHLNGSVVDHNGRTLFASRVGWTNARVAVTVLDDSLRPARTPVLLPLKHYRATAGQEDPRLFVFRDRLRLAFCGVEGGTGRTPVVTNQLVAELDDAFRVVDLWEPKYPGRTHPMEKNWVYFESGGEQYSIYSIEPHVVLRHDGATATVAATTAAGLAWEFGAMRGGATPVRVGDEFYHWFHGTRTGPGGPRYYLGLYTFAASAPFRVARWAPVPLALPPDRANREGKRVVFPCGAIVRPDSWTVSVGWNDAETRMLTFSREWVESQLRPVGGTT